MLFRGDVLLTVVYIPNCMPNKSVPTTPYELSHDRKSYLDHVCPWGLAGYHVHNPTHQHGKLGLKANKMAFLRYLKHSMLCKMKVDSHNVNFLEDEFSMRWRICIHEGIEHCLKEST